MSKLPAFATTPMTVAELTLVMARALPSGSSPCQWRRANDSLTMATSRSSELKRRPRVRRRFRVEKKLESTRLIAILRPPLDEAGTDVSPDREPGDGYALDAGHSGQALAEGIEILLGGGVIVPVCMEVGREGQGGPVVEAGVEDEEFRKASNQLAGDDEENATGADLAGEEDGASAARVRGRTSEPECRGKSEGKGGQQSDSEGSGHDAHIKHGGPIFGLVVPDEKDLQDNGAQEPRDEASSDGQQGAFREQLPHDTGAAGAQGETHVNFALACDAASEQKRSEIGAGNHQDQHDKGDGHRRRRDFLGVHSIAAEWSKAEALIFAHRFGMGLAKCGGEQVGFLLRQREG